MSSSPETFSLRRIAIPAFGPSVLFGLSEGAIFPVLALSARDLGADQALAGLIVALISVGSVFANLPAAALATRFGERRVMVGAALFSLVALILCLTATAPWMLAIAVLMIGGATAVFNLARQTFLIEVVPLGMRARAMSTLGGTMRIGMFAGPFLAALFIQFMGINGAYWAAILGIIGTGAICLAIPDLQTRRKTVAATPAMDPGVLRLMRRHSRAFLTLGLATALLSAIRSCRQVVVPLWADHIGLDATDAALIYGLMGAVDMLLFYPAGQVMDKHGRHWVALPCMLIMGVSLLLLPGSTSFAGLLAASLLLGMGNGIGSGLVMTIGADASPNEGRTRFLGIWRLITDSGGGLGPVLLSAMTAAFSLAVGVSGIGGLGFLSAYMYWRWLPRKV